jgi:hypothetical protein
MPTSNLREGAGARPSAAAAPARLSATARPRAGAAHRRFSHRATIDAPASVRGAPVSSPSSAGSSVAAAMGGRGIVGRSVPSAASARLRAEEGVPPSLAERADQYDSAPLVPSRRTQEAITPPLERRREANHAASSPFASRRPTHAHAAHPPSSTRSPSTALARGPLRSSRPIRSRPHARLHALRHATPRWAAVACSCPCNVAARLHFGPIDPLCAVRGHETAPERTAPLYTALAPSGGTQWCSRPCRRTCESSQVISSRPSRPISSGRSPAAASHGLEEPSPSSKPVGGIRL